MKKVVKLTEKDLTRIVKRAINEAEIPYVKLSEFVKTDQDGKFSVIDGDLCILDKEGYRTVKIITC